MHMPSGLCYGACNVVFFNVQQGVQQGTSSRTLSSDKVRDKVPYRAPYRAIRCAIKYLVAPPLSRDKVRDKVPCCACYIASFKCISFNSAVSGGTRCILYSLLLHPYSIFTHLPLSSEVTVVQKAPFGPC